MMLSVLVWLAMQGQVQRPWDDPVLNDAPIVQGQAYCCNPETDGPASVCGQYPQCLTTDESGHVTAQGWFPSEGRKPLTIYINGKPVPPREHVIEIKTRRGRRPVDFNKIGLCPKGFVLNCDYPTAKDECLLYSADGQTSGKLYCEGPVTRELWIDGVRWGVVKDVE